jgi:Domain of unknown function (DUF3786)
MKSLMNAQMNWKPPPSGSAAAHLAARAAGLRSTLRIQDPGLVAARSGSSWLMLGPGRGELHIPFWSDTCIFSFPELLGYNQSDETLPEFQQALLLYYLVTADGVPLTGRWVSFADLPDGRMYNAAFQGYSGAEVVDHFGYDLSAFKQACLHLAGKPVEIGSAAFVFQALPRVPLLMTYWLGDEDFPSSCKILFDASARHYLPIDACAVLGSTLAHKVMAAASFKSG